MLAAMEQQPNMIQLWRVIKDDEDDEDWRVIKDSGSANPWSD